MKRAPLLTGLIVLMLGLAASAWSEPHFPSPPQSALEPREESSGSASPGEGRLSSVPLASDVARSATPPDRIGWVAFRLVSAVLTVTLLLFLSLAGYRRLFRGGGRFPGASRVRPRRGGRLGWFSRWIPVPSSDADRLLIVARSYLGAKESLCLVQVGSERFLIGVTGVRISLLGKIEAASDIPASPEEPWASDFAQELGAAAIPRYEMTESAIRTALARSRDRLNRLSRFPLAAGERRV